MKINTPKFIFNTATDYFNLGEQRCKELFVPGFQNDKSLYLKISAPSTLLSFSLELLLKSLLFARVGNYPKTHELFTLYNNIPISDKQAIHTAYKKISEYHYGFPTFRFAAESSDSQKNLLPLNASTSDEIAFNLNIHDNSYVNWRYIFSFSADAQIPNVDYDFNFICRFFKAVHEHSKKLIH